MSEPRVYRVLHIPIRAFSLLSLCYSFWKPLDTCYLDRTLRYASPRIRSKGFTMATARSRIACLSIAVLSLVTQSVAGSPIASTDRELAALLRQRAACGNTHACHLEFRGLEIEWAFGISNQSRERPLATIYVHKLGRQSVIPRGACIVVIFLDKDLRTDGDFVSESKECAFSDSKGEPCPTGTQLLFRADGKIEANILNNEGWQWCDANSGRQ